jgi:ketosteroid isomerase-like protein
MELAYLQMDWVDAMKNRNAGWFEKNLAPDYTTTNFRTGNIVDKAGAVEDVKTNNVKFDSARILDMDIKVNGNTAIVTGVGHGVGTGADGKPFDNKVRFMDTFVRRNGRWVPLASQTMLIPESEQAARN